MTTDVATAADALRAGKLVAFATETVYGLGANALDASAVARIFAAKERPLFDPLIVHLAAREAIGEVCNAVPPLAERLIEAFWPGPLTLVLPRRDVVPDLVTAGLPDVAVRVPDHALARALIARAGVPVAAPSANLFGRVSPTTAAHVMEQLDGRIEVVLDGGPCRVGVESTIVAFDAGERPRVLRYGGIAVEALEAVCGTLALPQAAARHPGAAPGAQPAPGMLEQHYAPRKPLTLLDTLAEADAAQRAAIARGTLGVLAFRGLPPGCVAPVIETLSAAGSLEEAATRLFAALRRLDAAAVAGIVAERVPDSGLGRAVNDRLRRAAHA
ncbi:MAG: threonylcarbamoyl-AMP synthase [Gammaproteobacteria bacterium]|nr:threonylcarbamoyl-AMP synthase [Gammaproteobacteria bacterium]